MRETWRSVYSLLQVSKLCYSYALETKHMFSSRLLREPTCYFYPIIGRRGMTALSSLACSLSKIPLIKKRKKEKLSNQSLSLLPTAFTLFAASVRVNVCVWLVSLMPHLHIKSTKPVSCHHWMTASGNQRHITLITLWNTQIHIWHYILTKKKNI